MQEEEEEEEEEEIIGYSTFCHEWNFISEESQKACDNA